MINPLEIERNRWVSIAYIFVSVYFIIFLMIFWLRSHDLEDLICGYKCPDDIASNIEFYPLIKYFVENLLGIKRDISNKDQRVPDLPDWTGESRIQGNSPDSRTDPKREVISPGF
jgi:hypothetical protein